MSEEIHETALKQLQVSYQVFEEELVEAAVGNKVPVDLITLIAKLALLNGHNLNKIIHEAKKIDKGLGRLLAKQIKDSYNSYGWFASAGIGVAINAVGLVITGVAGYTSGAQAAHTYVQASQLASALTSPVTSYFQQRDEAGRSLMQAKQRNFDTGRSEQGQQVSRLEQKEDQLMQLLERVRQQDGQAKERINS